MPLPPPRVPRQRAHVRRIELEGYIREDGLLEIDAVLTDVKDIDFALESGVRSAGEPIHLLRVRVTVDASFTIVDAVAASDAVPYAGFCDTIAPAYRRLVGLNLVRGFRRQIGEMFGEVRGCSHLTELLMSLPTAAIQTMATFDRATNDSPHKPFQLDRCHALDSSGEVARRYYPKWYRRRSGAA